MLTENLRRIGKLTLTTKQQDYVRLNVERIRQRASMLRQYLPNENDLLSQFAVDADQIWASIHLDLRYSAGKHWASVDRSIVSELIRRELVENFMTTNEYIEADMLDGKQLAFLEKMMLDASVDAVRKDVSVASRL